MPPRKSFRPSLWLQGMVVVLLTMLLVGGLFQRFSWSDWGRPQWLEGDPLEVYARVKLAGEQPGHALFQFNRIERLGAPVGADWSAYPVPDRLVFVLTGLFSRAVGLIAAVQLIAALILGLNAASFYWCARWLRCRAEWALAGALLFAFANYNVRWGITLSLSQTFVCPRSCCCAPTPRGAGRRAAPPAAGSCSRRYSACGWASPIPTSPISPAWWRAAPSSSLCCVAVPPPAAGRCLFFSGAWSRVSCSPTSPISCRA